MKYVLVGKNCGEGSDIPFCDVLRRERKKVFSKEASSPESLCVAEIFNQPRAPAWKTPPKSSSPAKGDP